MDIVSKVQVDFTIMKEPRGFLRIIQLVLAIFAFATICTSSTATINVTCRSNNETTPVEIKYSYPFSLGKIKVRSFCAGGTVEESPFGHLSFAPAAQFFCFIGVMSFLLCLASCVAYIMFSSFFANDGRAAMVDFIFSTVWTVMWFIASTAWADRLTSMGVALKPTAIIEDLSKEGVGFLYCTSPLVRLCSPGQGGSHATLVVSVLFGFLNMLVWGAGLWFLYKETKWHKEQASDTQTFDQPGGAGTDSSYQTDPVSGPPTY